MPQQNREARQLIEIATLQKIVNSEAPEQLVTSADTVGKALAKQITSSQIRNVFGTARQIELRWNNDPTGAYREAVLLRPKISYQAKRDQRGVGMEELEKVLVPALEEVSKASEPKERHTRYKRFLDFFEAIVAYHKKYGGN